ncbi:MAG: hypothetical protein ABI811_17360 [Acidobacteriota bacterium]
MKAVCLAILLLAGVARADEISDAFDALKRAEAARNAADIRKYSVETSRLARAEMVKQLPPEVRNEYQKERAIYLSQTDIYTEYSMAVAAGWTAVDPAIVIQLTETIIAQNPKSDYLALAVPPYIAAMPNADQQLQAAAKILALQPDNEDALLAVADANLRSQKFSEASRAAAELLASISGKPRPERYTADSWRDRKAQLIVNAHFMAGVAGCSREAWQECDMHFRAIVSDDSLRGQVNFYLGWANYQVGKSAKDRSRLEEALRFSLAAAAVSGPMQEAATKNAAAIQRELSGK